MTYQPTITPLPPKPERPVAAGQTAPFAAPRRHRLRWTFVSVGALVLIIVLTAGWLIFRAVSVINTTKLDGTNKRLTFFQQLTHIVTAKNDRLQGEADDRVNILMLGIGGPGHDGPYLTDTMMVASIKPSTGQVALISIPRDLVVNIPGADYRKINSVLSIGRDAKYPGGGEALTVKVVSDLVNMPIQYYALLDFKGFQEVIDRVGGIDVAVSNAFSDDEFPTDNYGYQTISFKTGWQHMPGLTALNYARSRHGNNGEGSDFARARRQQLIMSALKDKLLSFGTLANPKKISDILGSLGSHSQTNMEVWEMLRLAKLVGNVSSDQLINKVIDSSADGFLNNEVGLGGAFILVPKDRNYRDIQFYAQNIFLAAAAEAEHATVLVANASSIAGGADAATTGLMSFDLAVKQPPLTIRNVTVDRTVLVDNGGGRFPKTVALLKLYKRSQGTMSLTDWETQTGDAALRAALETAVTANGNDNVNQAARQPPDIVLILGQDQPKSKALILVPEFKRPAPAKTVAAAPVKKTAGAMKTVVP